MLLWLSDVLQQLHSGFSVLQYITLRSLFAAMSALLLMLFLGPWMIRRLKGLQIGQAVRDDGPKSHLSKSGTPTMGGVMVLTSITLSTLLWGDLSNRFIWVGVLVMLAVGVVGWYDDYRKVILKNPKGLAARWKMCWLSLIAFVAVVFLYGSAQNPAETTLIIPFFKEFAWEMGWWYIPFAYFVIVGTSNAVNLTDGLDGLAIMPTVMVGGALGIVAYITGHLYFSNYLFLPYIPGTGELTIFCASLVGAGIGFLWFNTYPAHVFMGDVGSLALGAALGVLAVMVRQEFLLCIMGGIFVAETLSVIMQVTSFKLTGKRIFRMAPLHHHFELKGWPEPRVIVRFWIITLCLVLIGLATLKIR